MRKASEPQLRALTSVLLRGGYKDLQPSSEQQRQHELDQFRHTKHAIKRSSKDRMSNNPDNPTQNGEQIKTRKTVPRGNAVRLPNNYDFILSKNKYYFSKKKVKVRRDTTVNITLPSNENLITSESTNSGDFYKNSTVKLGFDTVHHGEDLHRDREQLKVLLANLEIECLRSEMKDNSSFEG